MSDLLSIGSSGVMAYQRTLASVSNNIANVGTEGYTRQTASVQSNQPRQQGSSYLGTGAVFQGVQRQYDAFIESNLRNSTSDLKSQEPLLGYVNRLIDVMGDANVGLTSAMNLFFESTRNLATNPADTVARGSFLRDSDGLSSRFRQLASQLDLMEVETRQLIQTDVGQVNALTQQLAFVNKQLTKHTQIDKQPSELLDQRDMLLRDLSGLTAIKTRFETNGAVLVSVGDTIDQGVLVNGATARSIGVVVPENNPRAVQFMIDPYGKSESLPTFSNGKLGGVMNFREQVLAPALSSLDNLARVVVNEVNQLHRGGLDAEGQIGGDLFEFSGAGPGGAATMQLALRDPVRIAAAGQFRVVENPLNVSNAQARVDYQVPALGGGAALDQAFSGGLVPSVGKLSLPMDSDQAFAVVGVVPQGMRDAVIQIDQAKPGQYLQVLTRDGRHLLGNALNADEQSLLMGSQNGMQAGASYSSSYLNQSGNAAYLDGDMFVGAKAEVRELQRFDNVTGNPLAAELAPARLVGGFSASKTDFSVAAGALSLNGVALSPGLASGADAADWFNGFSAQTGVSAAWESDNQNGVDGFRLVLSSAADDVQSEVRLGMSASGQPADLEGLGFKASVYIKGAAADDLLVFVTDRSAQPSGVDLSAQFASLGGDMRQALRQSPLEIEFTSDSQYRILDSASNTVLAERSFDASVPNASIDYRGLSVSFSSAVRAGDRFVIDGNRDGIGNNETLLKLAALENQRLMPGGLTMTEAYIERVNLVGNVARQASISEKALQVVYQQALDAREGASGVSLDEEAADLVRFQQAYQANAKVMQTASQMFDAILQLR